MGENEPTKHECPLGIKAIEFGEMIQTVKDIAEDVKEIRKDVKKQNGRVRSLESWRWYLVGIFTAVSVVISLLFQFKIL